MARILVVDDEPEMRRAFLRIVEEAGHEPFEAHNGVEALREIQKLKPALVLLDWMMPELRGDEVLEKLRNDPDYSEVKDTVVVILSEFGDELSQGDLQRLGANHVMSKKHDLDLVRDQIHSAMLGLKDPGA